MTYAQPSFVQRIQVATPSGPLRVNQPGILCVGVPSAEGAPALVLLLDEGPLNKAASLTNASGFVLRYLDTRWRSRFPVRAANLVEFDSCGDFDHVHVQWREGALPQVEFTPLRWAGEEPRSEGAFLKMFGEQARRAVKLLGELRPQGLSQGARDVAE